MPFSGPACSRHGRHCASRPRSIRPAVSSTFRCFETAGRLMSNGAASSLTEVSPEARRARMARRVGSASAAKVALRRSGVMVYLTDKLNRTGRLVKDPPDLGVPQDAAHPAARIRDVAGVARNEVDVH